MDPGYTAGVISLPMRSSALALLLQDLATGSSANLVRIVAGILALVMVVIIIFRRKGGTK
jgi:hypothetical protein